MNVTDPAKRDVADIHNHFAQHDITAADRLALRLYSHFDRIAASGHSGVPRDNIRPGLRLATHGRYNIYFRVTDSETIIVRVVHSARDAARLRFDQSKIVSDRSASLRSWKVNLALNLLNRAGFTLRP